MADQDGIHGQGARPWNGHANTSRGSARLTSAAVAAWIVLLTLPAFLSLNLWPWSEPSFQDPGTVAALVNEGPLAALALSLMLTLLVLALVRRAAVFVWLTFPLMILVPVESWYVIQYGSPSTSHVIGLIAETNAAEFTEFAAGRIQAALAGVGAIAAIAAIAATWIGRRGWRWEHRSRSWVVGATGLAIATGVGAAWLEEAATSHEVLAKRQSSVFGAYLPVQLDGVDKAFPWGVPLRIAEYVGQREKIERGMRELAGQRIGATLRAGAAPTNVVLVIGETGRADRLGINGYHRDTTPRLSRLEGIVSFSDAVSATAASRTSIPFMMTRMRPGTNLVFALVTEKSVVSAFREAGYRTWWLSNQMSVSQWDNGISIYAEEADVKRYRNLSGFGGRSDYDEVLIPELVRALRAPAEHRFIVLHTLGSHFNYRNRYPDAYDRFLPSLQRGERATIFDVDKRNELSNAYDNSVLYADHVLAEIIDRLAATGEDSVLLYMADHGESMFEGRCGKAGHGVASASNFHVPLIVWMSSKARERAPTTWQDLQANRSTPVTSESVFPTLMSLGGIAVPRDKHELSVASGRFAAKRRLVSADSSVWLDYDDELPSVDCASTSGSTPARR